MMKQSKQAWFLLSNNKLLLRGHVQLIIVMQTCTRRRTLCVCMFPIHCENKFWLLRSYYIYTIFGHIGVNTTEMWRTMASNSILSIPTVSWVGYYCNAQFA